MSQSDLIIPFNIGKKSDEKSADSLSPPQSLKIPFIIGGAKPTGLQDAKPHEVVAAGQSQQFPQRREEGFWNAVGDFFTGNARETRATRDLPEIGSELGLSELLGDGDSARKVTAAMALMTTFDPAEFVKIVEANTQDDVSVQYDEAGNIILNVGDRRGILNKPGASPIDFLQGAGTAAAFTPSGRATTVGTSGVAKVAGKSAATQAGIEAGQTAKGGEFNTGDVALAGAAGGAFRTLFQTLARQFPSLADQLAREGITPQMRNVVRQEAVRLGLDPKDITDDVLAQMVQETRMAVKPGQAMAVQGEREFSIPLTAAQRSLDDTALSFEDAARSGTKGESAQRVMRSFETEQQLPAVSAARDRVQAQLGGNPVSRSAEAGASLKEGVRAAERAADDIVQEAYSPENIGEAALSTEGVKGLLSATRKAILGGEFDRTLPETSKLLGLLQKTQKAQKMPGVRSTPMRQIEVWRKRLGRAIDAAENNADRAQLVTMKRSFDDYLDRAVINGLFEGDDQALSQMKQARELFREYAQKFRANPTRTGSGRKISDPEGGLIEKIVAADPTDEQVINSLFGATNFSNKAGANMAQRFKGILGEDSPGWQSVRQAAFRRIVKTNMVNGEEVISGQKTLQAIKQAVEENGSLMREIFTPDELGLMRRFALAVKRTQPDLVRSRENPSGSGVVALKGVADLIKRFTSVFAMSEPAFLVTSVGLQAGSGLRASSKAVNAVRPFQTVQPNTRAAIAPASGAGTAGGVAEGEEAAGNVWREAKRAYSYFSQ